ncbi:MAG: hypothetical protein GXP48_02980 [Acidobacteria bacterium]|nr:hypothetical protein [Acidobacteriota bacterium]
MESRNVFVVLCFIGILSFITVSTFAQNLLANPGAEAGDMSGWTIIANGGVGWGIWGVDTTDFKPPRTGDHCFLTSYGWDKRSQEIDLLAKGYQPSYLDSAPRVRVSEWFLQPNPYDTSRYYLHVELRDANHNALATWDTGVQTLAQPGVWYKISHEFTNYPAGVRYIYWEDGGIDSNGWNRYYGAEMDDAALELGTTTAIPTLSEAGMAVVILAFLVTGIAIIRRHAG